MGAATCRVLDLTDAEDACPLCGMGEAGSEHIVTYCTTARTAWEHLNGGKRALYDTVMNPNPRDHALATLLHQ
eukprot:5060741-Prorocentrum_lima.AAC.1